MAAGDLTTLAAVKSWCSVNGGADDTLLTRLISSISATVVNYVDCGILSATYSEPRNGNGRIVMAVPNRPITAVASVTVDGVSIPAQTVVGGTGFSFDDQFIYLSGYCFTRGTQNVRLVYTAGYPAVPADLEQAVIDVVAFKYKGRDRVGKSTDTLNGQTTSYTRDWPADAMRTFDQYKRRWPV